ncbi:MAG: hypothetical protein GDA39_00890, partial [Hyphomonadaceae bacterium]|nr:hypothetical protein [Hyphomonadaceae bacterium]
FPVFHLYGRSGVGKTHLGQAWIAAHGNGVEFAKSAEINDMNGFRDRIFLDDAEFRPESVLFCLLNKALNGEIKALLLVSQHPPSKWEIGLSDLRSRLSNIPSAQLNHPGDEALEDIIRNLFEARGRVTSAAVVKYLLEHADRSMSELRRLVVDLEQKARRENKDLTRHFVSTYIRSKTGQSHYPMQ